MDGGGGGEGDWAGGGLGVLTGLQAGLGDLNRN